MNVRAQSVLIAVAMILATPIIVPPNAQAQTPQQMEYERQQREYRQQMERQQQEQQRQQQLMNENARRQQEESRRLNTPMGQSPASGYPGAAPQTAPGRTVARPAAPVVTTANDWMNSCSSPAYGGTDVYLARSTLHRTGDRATMWDMYDFKNTQVADGIRYLSAKNQHEYDCKGKRRRMLSTTGYSGHMGKGVVVATDGTAFPWERVPTGDFVDTCYLKFACGK